MSQKSIAVLNKNSNFYWTRKFITFFARSIDMTLPATRLIQSTSSHTHTHTHTHTHNFFHLHFNIIIPSTTLPPIWTLPCRFSIIIMYAFAHLFYCPWLNHPNNIWWRVCIMKLRVRSLLSCIFTYFSQLLYVLKCLLSNNVNVVRKILNKQIIKQTKYIIEVLLLWVSGTGYDTTYILWTQQTKAFPTSPHM
jgi:hypothetical protein